MKLRTLNRGQAGTILVMVLVLLAITSMLSASFYAMLNTEMTGAYQRQHLQTAMNLADAGLEKAVAELRTNPAYAGEENTPLGGGAFSVTLDAGPKPGSWQITSTGIFQPNAGIIQIKARARANLRLDEKGRVLALDWREAGPCR